MATPSINATAMARQWSQRVTERMRKAGVPEVEIQETANIMFSFVKTAVELLVQDPVVTVPELGEISAFQGEHTTEIASLFEQKEPFTLDVVRINQVIELFIRSVNQMSKELRSRGLAWEERKRILEEASWETFNLAKLLVTLFNMPNSKFKLMEQNETFIMELIKQGTAQTLHKYLNPSYAQEKTS